MPKSPDQTASENRIPTDLEKEIEPTLSHLDPIIQKQVRALAESGHDQEAEDELIEFILEEDHVVHLRKLARRKTKEDESILDNRVYLLSLIPVVIILYFVLSILFTGHIRWH